MKKLLTAILLFLSGFTYCQVQTPATLLLKNYRPQSIYKIPQHKIEKARFGVIDMHSHPYASTQEELVQWLKVMDHAGIRKTIILSMASGEKFDSIYAVYSKYPDRFEVWCGLDFRSYPSPGWQEKVVKELERCYQVGARGVGEISDKGYGILNTRPTPAYGPHIDDPGNDLVIKKCAELNMPISIHVAEPMWMYQPMDSTNDGLMNSYDWRVDTSVPGFIGHSEVIKTLERAVSANPGTTFIACHLANCEYDLELLGKLLDRYPNLYADMAARFGETATIPRYMSTFYTKYQNKIVYGTDNGMTPAMYETTFRILETADEHFYEPEYNYHWPYHGFDLKDKVLKKVYAGNAEKILKR
jgi:predicted TIM-barrel fold metal-dependent hydrolase